MDTPLTTLTALALQLLTPIFLSTLLFRHALRTSRKKFDLGHPVLMARVASAALLITGGMSMNRNNPQLLAEIFHPADLTWPMAVALAVAIILIIGLPQAIQRYPSLLKSYPQIRVRNWTPFRLSVNVLTWVFYLFGYEFLFRGVLLHVTLGFLQPAAAVILNLVIYALAHWHKGAKESLGSIPFGLVLCILTLSTGSMWSALMLHACLAIGMELCAIKAIQKTRIRSPLHPVANNNGLPVVLITGASAGIGKALAFSFAQRGKDLLLVALPHTDLEAVADSVRRRFHVTVFTLVLDLTDKDAPAYCYNFCRDHGLRVNVLVNNAGFGNLQLFASTPAAQLQQLMQLNNVALVMLSHTFMNDLKSFSQAYVLNVGSLAGFMPLPKKAVYAASKSFVFTFSYSLYLELKPFNVHVSCLCPGGTLTERVVKMMNEQNLNRRRFCQRPEEVADVAVQKLYQKKFRIIPGRRNRALYYLSNVLPEFIKCAMIGFAFRQHSRPVRRARLSRIKALAAAGR